MTTTTTAPREGRDSLDDSWFDHPARPFQRPDTPSVTKAPPAPAPAQRDDSVELDDPWFGGGGWR